MAYGLQGHGEGGEGEPERRSHASDGNPEVRARRPASRRRLTMKRTLLVGALGGLLVIGAAATSAMAQDAKSGEAKAPAKAAKAAQAGGHVSATAPKQQGGGPEEAPAVPAENLALGSVRLGRAAKANG